MGGRTRTYFGVAILLGKEKRIKEEVKYQEEVNLDSNGTEYSLDIKYSPDTGELLKKSLATKVKITDETPCIWDITEELGLDEDEFIWTEPYGEDHADIEGVEAALRPNSTIGPYNFRNFIPDDYKDRIRSFEEKYKEFLKVLPKYYDKVEVNALFFAYWN